MCAFVISGRHPEGTRHVSIDPALQRSISMSTQWMHQTMTTRAMTTKVIERAVAAGMTVTLMSTQNDATRTDALCSRELMDGYKQPTASTHEGNRWRDLVPEIKDVMITMAASSQRRCGCCFEELPPDAVRFRCPCQLQDFCGMCDDRLHPQSSVHIWQRWDAATLSWVARTTVPRLTWSRHVDGVGGSDLNTAIGCTCEGRSHQSARVDLLTFDGMFTCICSHRCGPPCHIVCRFFRYC